MGSLLARAILCLGLVLLASSVRADVLFSQPVIGGGVALASDFARFQQEAGNFTLSQSALVETVQWWGAYANNDVRRDNFTLRLLGDVAGNPAMTPLVDVSALNLTRAPTNLVDNLGDPIYEYEATVPIPVPLDGATSYYVSIVNNTPPGGVWDWVGSGPGTHWARQDDASAWTVSSGTTGFGFELLGTPIPEPSTFMLLGIGTLIVVGYARRRGAAT
jgi:PEP-CTERM motif